MSIKTFLKENHVLCINVFVRFHLFLKYVGVSSSCLSYDILQFITVLLTMYCSQTLIFVLNIVKLKCNKLN